MALLPPSPKLGSAQNYSSLKDLRMICRLRKMEVAGAD